jgi:hypothetical protein
LLTNILPKFWKCCHKENSFICSSFGDCVVKNLYPVLKGIALFIYYCFRLLFTISTKSTGYSLFNHENKIIKKNYYENIWKVADWSCSLKIQLLAITYDFSMHKKTLKFFLILLCRNYIIYLFLIFFSLKLLEKSWIKLM